MQLWRSGESCERSHRLIVPLNCYKLKMKVCLCFYRNNITQLMWQGKYAPPSCFCLFSNNWLKRLLSKPHNMIIGKCNFGGAEKVKLWTITCENKENPHALQAWPVPECCSIWIWKPARDQRATGSSSISEEYQGADRSLAVMVTWSMRFNLCAKLYTA